MTTLRRRARDLGIAPGVLPTAKWNAITDIDGVKVGHVTLIEADDIRTGVTAILPHSGNLFQEKVPAGIVAGNGFDAVEGDANVAIRPSTVQRRICCDAGGWLNPSDDRDQHGVEVIRVARTGDQVPVDSREDADQAFAAIVSARSATEGIVLAHDVSGSDERFLRRIQIVGVRDID